MFTTKKHLPTPKPDPPPIFTGKFCFEIGLCLVAILFCVSTIKYIDSQEWHEEKITRYYHLEMDIKCNKKSLE